MLKACCYHDSRLARENVIDYRTMHMNIIFSKLRDCLVTCAAAAALLTPAAQAGTISFNLTLDDNRLTLINHGDSAAFYPTVLRMLADGRWEALKPAASHKASAEMRPNAQASFDWPDSRPLSILPPLEALQPVMVRFFDQAGASFGQISFFHQPPTVDDKLAFSSHYADGKMIITPPKDHPISVSWLLWPQEEGIAPLTAPIRFTHHQPDARKIEWRAGMDRISMDLGKGLPAAYLLHETPQGFASQILHNGSVQGRQQRSAWLDASLRFDWLARLAAAAAAALFAWHLGGSLRPRSDK